MQERGRRRAGIKVIRDCSQLLNNKKEVRIWHQKLQ